MQLPLAGHGRVRAGQARSNFLVALSSLNLMSRTCAAQTETVSQSALICDGRLWTRQIKCFRLQPVTHWAHCRLTTPETRR